MGGFRFGKERLEDTPIGGSGLTQVTPTTMQMTDPSTRLSRVLTGRRPGSRCLSSIRDGQSWRRGRFHGYHVIGKVKLLVHEDVWLSGKDIMTSSFALETSCVSKPLELEGAFHII